MSSPAPARPRPVHRAADLLAAYLPGSFYYSSARGVLLADGVHSHVRGTSGNRAAAAAEALEAAVLAGVANPVVVGAIGFRPDSGSSLIVPAVVRRAGMPGEGGPQSAALAGSPGGSGFEDPEAPRRNDPASWTVVPRPAPEVYAESVRRAVDLIGAGELRKVVLARALDLVGEHGVSVRKLLRNLVVADPAAHAFAVDVSAPGDPAPRTLVGASPELLVSRQGNVVTANPLAGSRRRTGDPAQDAQAIAELRVSEKDLNEHALVAAQVAEVLGRYCTELEVPREPEVMGTPTMWHLSTRITGRVGPGGPSSLELAEALHPTPAVCGVPVELARDTIARLEPEDRGYYAGLVGWTDLAGDGEWVVTIRCAEVSDKTARLFAGAGVVAGSDPAAELAETSAKFGTLLRALGAEGAA
ncbi:isochorismate synthase [Amycolatopsis rubida]|uniref:isochorismate synthase n=1 Tax=Amycolatopsis rubida TaxID=112413 RepID=A0ABX0BJD3_9PSEU|nr:isochorismate synthase [Amycolatopsis sp. M39]MYW90613.1 isochorismate synthase [Amycolatopsis rubida]NEC55594.1 isochorismate synthase [Amycolatopsis rubida]OAP29088.1 Isochorismate synthase DhbC [Amycolatopsis sp. M39]